MDTLLTELQGLLKEMRVMVDEWMTRLTSWGHSIRFKLAFTYSLILFIFAGGLVLAFNVYLSQNLRQDPVQKNVYFSPFFTTPPDALYDFDSLKMEEKLRIREIRLYDLRRIQQTSVYSLVPLALLSFAVGYYFSGKYFDPLAKLRANIEKLGTKDLGVELAKAEDDEVGSLIDSFNNLSTRLREAFNSQEQFVQNASHELRTPLAIIQTNLDTALDNPQIKQSQLREAVEQALIGVKQLTKLVNYLLELTSRPSASKTLVDLRRLVRAQITALSVKVKKSDYRIKLQMPATQVHIHGDEVLLERVIQNLLENAINYSTPVRGKRLPILVSVGLDEGKCVLSVSNGSHLIQQNKLKRIFERFYQVEPSRSKKLGGYGLGLAIVKKVIEEHQGIVTATNTNNITTIMVTLPLMANSTS
jgi:signal transduction histidine kinase